MPGRCWACDARQPIGGSVGDVTRSEPCGLCSSMQIAEPRREGARYPPATGCLGQRPHSSSHTGKGGGLSRHMEG